MLTVKCYNEKITKANFFNNFDTFQ